MVTHLHYCVRASSIPIIILIWMLPKLFKWICVGFIFTITISGVAQVHSRSTCLNRRMKDIMEGGGKGGGSLIWSSCLYPPPLSLSFLFPLLLPIYHRFFTKRWADTSDFFILRGHNYLPMSPHPFGIQNSCPKYCSHLNINNMPTPYSVHHCFGVSKLPARTQSGMRPGERCPRI